MLECSAGNLREGPVCQSASGPRSRASGRRSTPGGSGCQGLPGPHAVAGGAFRRENRCVRRGECSRARTRSLTRREPVRAPGRVRAKHGEGPPRGAFDSSSGVRAPPPPPPPPRACVRVRTHGSEARVPRHPNDRYHGLPGSPRRPTSPAAPLLLALARAQIARLSPPALRPLPDTGHGGPAARGPRATRSLAEPE
jgi:hypothetical protein